MKREFLKGLGLEDEVVEKIMGEHGKTMGKLTAAETTIETLNAQIAERDKDIKTLQKSVKDNEDLTTQFNTLTEKYKTEKAALESQIQETKLNHAIDMSLSGQVYDLDIVRSLVDKSKLTFDDTGALTGLDDQVKSLQETKAFLFKTEDTSEKDKGFFSGAKPQEGNLQKNQAGQNLSAEDAALFAGFDNA